MTAPYTDTYKMASENTASIKVYDGDKVIAEEATELTVDLTEGAAYTLCGENSGCERGFCAAHRGGQSPDYPALRCGYTRGCHEYLAGKRRYRPRLFPPKWTMSKREGGTYIYSNNPEQIAKKHVGQAFMRNASLTGEVYVTLNTRTTPMKISISAIS